MKHILVYTLISLYAIFSNNLYGQCPTSCGISATDEQGVFNCDGTVTISGIYDSQYANSNFSFVIIDSVSNTVTDSVYSTIKPYVFDSVCPGTYFYRIYDSTGTLCCGASDPCLGSGVTPTSSCAGAGSGGSATVQPFADIDITFTPSMVCVSGDFYDIEINSITGTDPPFDITISLQDAGMSQSQNGVLGNDGPYFFSFTPGFGVPLCDVATMTVTDANGYSESFDVSNQCYEPPFINSIAVDACSGQCNGQILVWVDSWGFDDNWNSQIYSWNGPHYISGAYDTIVIDNLCPDNNYTVNYDFCPNWAQPIITVDESSPMIASANQTQSTCPGTCSGSGTANATGGDGNYTYIWMNSSSQITSTIQSPNNLCNESYNVFVTDGSGCSASDFTYINNSPSFSNTFNNIDNTCDYACDGNVSASTTGNSGLMTYTWEDSQGNYLGNSSSITNICPGAYTLISSEAGGCENEETIVIGSQSSLEVTISQINETCEGDCNAESDAFAEFGVNPISYYWTNTQTDTIGSNALINSLCPGKYFINVVDAIGCESFHIVDLLQGESVDFSNFIYTVPSTTGGADGSIEVVSTNAVLYSIDGGTNQSSNSFTGLEMGTYTICAETSIGCDSCQVVVLDVSSNINEHNASVSVYPNPTSHLLHISNYSSNELIILNGIGQVIENKIITNGTVDLSDLSKGIYLIKIDDAVFKVFKE